MTKALKNFSAQPASRHKLGWLLLFCILSLSSCSSTPDLEPEKTPSNSEVEDESRNQSAEDAEAITNTEFGGPEDQKDHAEPKHVVFDDGENTAKSENVESSGTSDSSTSDNERSKDDASDEKAVDRETPLIGPTQREDSSSTHDSTQTKVQVGRISFDLLLDWKLADPEEAIAALEPRDRATGSLVQVFRDPIEVVGDEAQQAYVSQYAAALGIEVGGPNTQSVGTRKYFEILVRGQETSERLQRYWHWFSNDGVYTIVITTRESTEEEDRACAETLLTSLDISGATAQDKDQKAKLPFSVTDPEQWLFSMRGACVLWRPQVTKAEQLSSIIPECRMTFAEAVIQDTEMRKRYANSVMEVAKTHLLGSEPKTTELNWSTRNQMTCADWESTVELVQSGGESERIRVVASYIIVFGNDATYFFSFIAGDSMSRLSSGDFEGLVASLRESTKSE